MSTAKYGNPIHGDIVDAMEKSNEGMHDGVSAVAGVGNDRTSKPERWVTRVRRSYVDEIPAETARVIYFIQRYGVGRGVLDGLVKRKKLRKYKFGSGRSGPVVYSIDDFEGYMKCHENLAIGG